MAWGTGVSDAAPDATKSHRDAVNRDIEAMTTRANKRQASRNKPDEAERVAAMPLILKHKTDRFAFQFGRGSALRRQAS
jgi:predicted methyltransferase